MNKICKVNDLNLQISVDDIIPELCNIGGVNQCRFFESMNCFWFDGFIELKYKEGDFYRHSECLKGTGDL